MIPIPLDFVLFVPPAIVVVITARLAWWAAGAILAALRAVLATADWLADLRDADVRDLDWTRLARATGVLR